MYDFQVRSFLHTLVAMSTTMAMDKLSRSGQGLLVGQITLVHMVFSNHGFNFQKIIILYKGPINLICNRNAKFIWQHTELSNIMTALV